MEVIDVSIVGGPDLASIVERRNEGGATVVLITVANDGPVPARLQRVVIPIESPPVRTVVAPGWEDWDPGVDRPLAGAEVAGVPAVATDQGTVGWLGAACHRGEVTVQRDGWLLTASADLAGILLWPGERLELDPLWLGAGGDLPGLARSWATHLGRGRPAGNRPVTGIVVSPGARGLQDAIDAGRRAWGADDRLLVAGPGCDVERVAAVARTEGAALGVVIAPFGTGSEPADLTRPETLLAVRATGEEVAATGASWIVVTGGAAGAASRPRWGDAATTPVAALRAGVQALRDGLGPDPVVHLAGGPPAALAGVADVIDAGPGWPDPGALGALRRRAAFHGVVWQASPGPLPHGAPPSALEEVRALSGPRLLWPPGLQPAGEGAPAPRGS